GKNAEEHREELSEPVLFLKYLLGGAEITDEGAEDETGRHHIAERDRVGEGLARRSQYLGRRKLAARLGRMGFGLPDGEPEKDDQRNGHKAKKDRAPGGDEQNSLADRGSENRHQNEDRHHERHDARHAAPAMEIAHHGDSDDAWTGGAEALEDAPGNHQVEIRRECADEAAQDLQS